MGAALMDSKRFLAAQTLQNFGRSSTESQCESLQAGLDASKFRTLSYELEAEQHLS